MKKKLYQIGLFLPTIIAPTNSLRGRKKIITTNYIKPCFFHQHKITANASNNSDHYRSANKTHLHPVKCHKEYFLRHYVIAAIDLQGSIFFFFVTCPIVRNDLLRQSFGESQRRCHTKIAQNLWHLMDFLQWRIGSFQKTIFGKRKFL